MKNKRFNFNVLTLLAIIVAIVTQFMSGGVLMAAVTTSGATGTGTTSVGAEGSDVGGPAMVTEGAEGGVVVKGISTRQSVDDWSAALNLNTIARKVVKVKAASNPFLTLIAGIKKEHTNSPRYEFYSVSGIPAFSYLGAAHTEEDTTLSTISTLNNGIFNVYDSIIVKDQKGFLEDGVTPSVCDLMLYVESRADNGQLIVSAVNGKKGTVNENIVPSIPETAKLIRAGKAHDEITLQTSPYSAMPTKDYNYVQKFKAQIEQSTLQKIAEKEVDWTFSDQEEMAIDEMKRGMTVSYLFGPRRVKTNKAGKDVYFTGGVWYQAGLSYSYGDVDKDNAITPDELIEISKKAFTTIKGSTRKTWFVGSTLLARLSKIGSSDRVMNDNVIKTRFAIDLHELRTNFGVLEIVHEMALDDNGLTDAGIIIDFDYIKKWSMADMTTTDYDMRKAGQKDVDARCITDISSLNLVNRKTHMVTIPAVKG